MPLASRSIRAVLFDFDGVIVDSEPLHLRAFQSVAATEGVALADIEYYQFLIGYDDRGAWRALFALRDRPLDESTLAGLLSRKSDAMDELMRAREFTAHPGVEELTGALSRAGIAMGICSGALRDEIEHMLAGVGLREHFSIITSAQDVRVGKPDPSGYLLTARRVGEMIGVELRPDECLVIEDAPSVAVNARGAGFEVLGVATTFPAGAWPQGIPVVPSLHVREVARAVPRLGLSTECS